MTDLTIPDEARAVLTHLETVFIEGNPFGGWHEPAIREPYSSLPVPFFDAIGDLMEQIDSVQCWRCSVPVAFVLSDRDYAESVEWQPTALVREPDGPVAVLCADCAPYVPDAPATHSAGAA